MQAMQENAAVFRTGSVLKEGCEKIDKIFEEFDDIKVYYAKLLSELIYQNANAVMIFKGALIIHRDYKVGKKVYREQFY